MGVVRLSPAARDAIRDHSPVEVAQAVWRYLDATRGEVHPSAVEVSADAVSHPSLREDEADVLSEFLAGRFADAGG